MYSTEIKIILYSILQKKEMDYSNKYKYASVLWKIGLTFFLISILFLTPLIEIESTGHVDSDPFVLTYSYMFFEGGFRSIINSDFFADKHTHIRFFQFVELLHHVTERVAGRSGVAVAFAFE